MFLYLLIICTSVAMGQLVLGPCPIPPGFVQDLDLQKYSGDWYAVAQSMHHPLKASDCQRVKYLESNSDLAASFSYLDNFTQLKTYTNATLRKERGKSSTGERQLRFENFPRSYQFRVLHTNYSDVAVEYICLSGVFNYTAHLTVLHRRTPTNQGDLSTTLQHLNLTSHVTPNFQKNMKIVYHTKCYK